MIKEIFQNYGPIWELWWDGANGEGPNGKKQVYDWQRFEQTVRSISPQTVIFSDIGPDIRWVGNEHGVAGKTNWNLLDTAGFKRGLGAPPNDTLLHGNYKGAHYIPAEVDVSIRPGWFYHKAENSTVKSPEQLFTIYLESVGRGANLLLNVPPDNRGLIHLTDAAALVGLNKKVDELYSRNLLKGASLNIAEPDRNNLNKPFTWYYILKESVPMRGIILQEDLKYGQKISGLQITISHKGAVLFQEKTTTIGNKRIILFPQSMEVSEIALVVTGSKGTPLLKKVTAF